MNFPTKTALAVATTLAILAVGARFFQLFPAQTIDRLFAFHATAKRNRQEAPLPTGKNFGKNLVRAKLPKRAPFAGVEPVVDPQQNLDGFFSALYRVERGLENSRVRIAHYGDSPTTADLITADARELLQRQFGNAGHGYYLIAKPWAWYGHRGVDSDASGWEIEAATTAKNRDGLYGYGGVSFRGAAGARARFRLKDAGTTRVEIAYARQPNGGTIQVTACGEKLGEVTTDGESGSEFTGFAMPEPCRDLVLTATGNMVRAYGVSFLRAGPGVVYDSLGINGAYISVLAKFLRAEHWAEQLRHHQPDLVVINYGTNESVYAAFVDKVFEKELRETIRRVKTALPGKSVLVMSPMDRGTRGSTGEIETVPAIEKLVKLEEKVAAEEGVAFFSTFAAMGGNGTMRAWYEGSPRLVGADFIHPMPAGAKRIGEFLFRALLDSYNHFKTRQAAPLIEAASVERTP